MTCPHESKRLPRSEQYQIQNGSSSCSSCMLMSSIIIPTFMHCWRIFVHCHESTCCASCIMQFGGYVCLRNITGATFVCCWRTCCHESTCWCKLRALCSLKQLLVQPSCIVGGHVAMSLLEEYYGSMRTCYLIPCVREDETHWRQRRPKKGESSPRPQPVLSLGVEMHCK